MERFQIESKEQAGLCSVTSETKRWEVATPRKSKSGALDFRGGM